MSGVWKGWRDLRAMGLIDRMPRLLCAQAAGSPAISRAVWAARAESFEPDWRALRIAPARAETIADSISVDLPRDGLAAVRAVLESDGAAVAVSDEAILDAIPEIARRGGVFCEPAAACAWAALRAARAEGIIDPASRVVCLLTGSGLKDIPAARKSVGEPLRVEPDLAAALHLLSIRGL